MPLLAKMPPVSRMTYRLQYNSSEYRGLLASSLMAWAAEDRDLAIVSLEGHVLQFKEDPVVSVDQL